MLRFLTLERRRFGFSPVPVQQQINWEFCAVLKGRIGASTRDSARPVLSSRCLWVFPPETAHGWTGGKLTEATVAGLHFGMVPRPLAILARSRGCLRVPLSAEQVKELQALVRELTPHFESPNACSLLHYDRALISLTLMALDGQPPGPEEEDGDERGAIKVEEALSWYGEHIEEQPKLGRVAARVGLSQSHLRRLFWKCRKQGPHQAFIEVKMRHALELMSLSDLKLDAVAAGSGFTSSIDFCRAFKRHFGVSPALWRKKPVQAFG